MNKKQKLAALGAAGAVTTSCAFSALAYFKATPNPVEKKIVVHPVVRIKVEQDHRFDPGSNQVEINQTGN